MLHYLSEWSMKEIGQFFNMSVSAVESRIRRAREVLKQHLALARDFEHYFHTHRLGRDFEQQVSEQVLKRAGHFYIPVTDKRQATAWFILHFHPETSRHGNPVSWQTIKTNPFFIQIINNTYKFLHVSSKSI
ncbi:sigma factor-like helix-turn-helix DNA-binding protein [Paenibacillus sp. FSL F4-0100]|uniref:RNA polymerase sigma factor n=1 Tax=Paenibacillus sp. FSL F4-0100 TaxID=2921370 RepID=UPI0030ED4A21